jgi:hypothetical protein
VELDYPTSFSPFMVGRRMVSTRPRRGGYPGYMPTAAAAVRDLLARNQIAVPFYAFGHTHAAMRSALGTDAWYLNSGTWSTAAWRKRAGPQDMD